MFHDITFPLNIAIKARGGPCYYTSIQTNIKGAEIRIIEREYPINKYLIENLELSSLQYDNLLGFFRARKGRAYSFRFRDYFDYKAEKEPIAIGDNETVEFQLTKTYKDLYDNSKRIITKPSRNTVSVYIDEKKQDSYKLDYNKGIICFDKPPREDAIIEASFQFEVEARFDIDYLDAEINNNNMFKIAKIIITEVV